MRASPPEPGASLFSWSVWLILAGGALGLVVAYGPTFPIWDDFDIVPVLCGARPLTLGYLWSQHNEHRLFLTRLLELAAYHLSGGDFRAGMFASVLLMAGASAVLMGAARRARGHASYSDALFPLLLLGPAHHESFLWSSNVTNVAPVALAAVLLAILWTGQGWPGPARAAGLGLLLCVLTLCNAVGVAFAPAPALWMLAGAVAVGRAGGEGAARRSAVLALGGLAPLALTFLYFRGLERAAQAPEAPGLLAVAGTAAQFLGMALGPASITVGAAAGWAVAGMVVMAGGVLIFSIGKRKDIPGHLGLLAFLGSVLLLAAGVGWGRSGLGGLAGAQARYATMAAPALLLVAVAFERAGLAATPRLVPMALFTALVLLLWPNGESALAAGRETRAKARAFLADLGAGVPRHLLIQRHVPYVHPSHEELGPMLDLLRSSSIGPFRRMAPDPPMAEIAVPLDSVRATMATWDTSTRTATVTGADPYLVVDLPTGPRYIAGVRLRYDHSNTDGSPAHFKLGWRRADQAVFPIGQEYAQWAFPSGPDREATIWLGSPASQLRLQPDSRPCSFTIRELTLLVPRG